MVLIAVETMPAGSKPLVAISVRIYTDGRCGLGTSAPLLTKASSLQSLQGRTGGSVKSSLELVRHIGSGSAWEEELSPLIIRSAAASSVNLTVWFYVWLHGET